MYTGQTVEETVLGEHQDRRESALFSPLVLTRPLSHANENKPDTGLWPEVQTHTDTRPEHHKNCHTLT